MWEIFHNTKKLPRMKSKIFLLNIMIYLIIYHFIFEGLINIYNLNNDINIFTPIGRVLRKLVLNQNIYKLFFGGDFLFFSFNLFVSVILFYIVNKYYSRNSISYIYFKLLITFIVINLILIGLFMIVGIGMATIPGYILYSLIPMIIMVILFLPLIWINKKILNIS